MFILVFLSTLLPLYLASPIATANFGSAENNDSAIGWVTVQDGNVAVYLDLTYGKMDGVFSDACLQGGFTYHIHTQWDSSEGTWGTYAACSSAKTAYHYDPYAACGGNTDNALCTQRGGCIAAGSGSGTYSCDTDNFDMNPLYCEVGDWSGKYGKLYATNDDNTTFMGNYSSFFEPDADLLQNQSVVFHCDGARALCAVFDVSGTGTDDKPDQEDMKSVVVDFSDAIESYDSGYDGSAQTVTAQSDGSWTIDFTFSQTAATALASTYATCDTSGLDYYIFPQWNSAMDSLWGDSACTTATGGYTWDPTNQCLPMSNSSYCDGSVQCDGNGNEMIYNCSSDVDYSCAPGDLSGRWGILQIFTGISLSGTDDELPNLANIVGASVGVLCDSTFIMCGRIQDISEATATATFNSNYTNVTGYVEVMNQEVTVNLDLSTQTLPDGCASESGLSWHIHNDWTHTDNMARHGSVSDNQCGSGYTGGHYDPYNGCGGATDNVWCSTKSSGGACTSVGTYTNSSTFNPYSNNVYTCNETYFADYPYACEVGDWSGKYGNAMLNGDTMSGTWNTQFAEVRATDLIGRSIVFHCGGGASKGMRVFCAPFEIEGTDGNDIPGADTSTSSDLALVAYLQDITGSGDMTTNYVKIYDNGYYQVVITTTGVDNVCSTASNYRLSLYNTWSGTAQTTGSTCSSLYDTFYDPGYTCPPQVDNSPCDCIENNSYSYACDYDSDKFTCAAGDLTGKYGYVYPNDVFYAVGYDLTLPSLTDLESLAVVLECNGDNYAPIGCTGFSTVSNDPTVSPTDTSPGPTASPVEPGSPTAGPTITEAGDDAFRFNNVLYISVIAFVITFFVY